MDDIKRIRDAVAKALEERGLDNRKFVLEICDGKRDDGPYMLGAIASAGLQKTGTG